MFRVIEQITVTFFIIDYLLRWITADFRSGKGGWSFVLYPVTGWAIIALPSGVITASYLDELRSRKKGRGDKEKPLSQDQPE